MIPRCVLLLTFVLMPAGVYAAPGTPRERARLLAEEAAALIEQGKLADAEAALVEATELGPPRPLDLYNLACVRARLNRPDAALDSLERAAAAGFTDFARISRDADLDPLRDLPRFKQFLTEKDAYLRRTAEGTLVALRNRFGDQEYRYAIDHEQHLIVAAAVPEEELSRLRSGLRAQADSLQTALFEEPPEAYVTVLMPTAADYGKLVRFRNVPGIYLDETKTVVAREAGYVLAHEFTHALHAADRAPLGQEHAPWVAEGLGVVCEAADFEGGEFRPRDNPRFRSLVAAARRKALIPLERLVAMTQGEFVRRPNLTYGQAGYLILYLDDRRLLRPFYDAYKSTFDADPTGRTALEQTCGKKLPELHEGWRLWLSARKPAKAE